MAGTDPLVVAAAKVVVILEVVNKQHCPVEGEAVVGIVAVAEEAGTGMAAVEDEELKAAIPEEDEQLEAPGAEGAAYGDWLPKVSCSSAGEAQSSLFLSELMGRI
ncbi:hypothetical protein BGZ80_000265 [Entomortierella chlamydospora]|uniref:Uncharacterized protein n=1 Tax=Entomortierella chlamydospora TaxID=101097 RepID=A0A9P6T3G6_9FUNG|nr:hypothetical protein BGZ80_000265 [Entomortierella chlamydospora]